MPRMLRNTDPCGLYTVSKGGGGALWIVIRTLLFALNGSKEGQRFLSRRGNNLSSLFWTEILLAVLRVGQTGQRWKQTQDVRVPVGWAEIGEVITAQGDFSKST